MLSKSGLLSHRQASFPVVLVAALALAASAQSPQPAAYGAPPFRFVFSGHYAALGRNHGLDRRPSQVYSPDLNATETIGIFSKPGRGVPVDLNLIYNSDIYRKSSSGAFEPIGQETPSGLQHVWWGWLPMTQNGYAMYDVMTWTCTFQVCTQYGCNPIQESYPEYY